MKKMFEEFKAFIMRGNVLDMAVGVIVAGAFGKITTSLVNDLFMPFISWIFGSRDMTALNVIVRPEIVNEAGEVTQAAITLGFGTFVATIIDFILIAFVVFMVVKLMNTAKDKLAKKEEEAPAEEPAKEPKPTKEELLLAEIRDLLKEKK
jgi:large conductance mechanosensitive channel